jgi:hypothetical protein
MRIAINGEKYVDSLVGFYRDEIDKFNDERAEWAINYELCKQNVQNNYLLDKEIDDSRYRINQLESELGVTKANLTYERQKYFKKLEETEAVKGRLE